MCFKNIYVAQVRRCYKKTRLVNPEDATLRPVKIGYFVKVSYTINTILSSMCLVIVLWFQPHPCRFVFGKPAQVRCPQLFEVHGVHSFLLLNNLCCRCVYSTVKLKEENVLPLVE